MKKGTFVLLAVIGVMAAVPAFWAMYLMPKGGVIGGLLFLGVTFWYGLRRAWRDTKESDALWQKQVIELREQLEGTALTGMPRMKATGFKALAAK